MTPRSVAQLANPAVVEKIARSAAQATGLTEPAAVELAVVAVVFGEPEREAYVRCMEQAERVLVSAVSVVETRTLVNGRRGPRGVVLLDDLLRLPMIEAVAVSAAEMDAAHAAFVVYGKGSGHPGAVNFGDVFSYALAKVRGLPLRCGARGVIVLNQCAGAAPRLIGSAPRQRSARRAGCRNRRPASKARH